MRRGDNEQETERGRIREEEGKEPVRVREHERKGKNE